MRFLCKPVRKVQYVFKWYYIFRRSAIIQKHRGMSFSLIYPDGDNKLFENRNYYFDFRYMNFSE